MPLEVVSVSKSTSPLPLLSNEEIIFRRRAHFVIPFFLIFLLWISGGTLIWIFWKFRYFNLIPKVSAQTLLMIFIGTFIFVGLIILLSWIRTHYILTNRRVEWRFGILSQGLLSISLNHIENVSTTISVLGMIFGYGNIVIEPAGISQAVKFGGITEPKECRKKIEDNMP